MELGSDGITEALLGSLSSRSTASARGRRARPRLGPIKQGTKTYLARSIVPILIEGLTQLSIVRPAPTKSTMGPGVWLAQFLLERSSQAADYEIKRLNVGLNVRTQTMYDEEYPMIAKKATVETQTRLGGRAAQVSIGDGKRGMIQNNQQQQQQSQHTVQQEEETAGAPSLIREIKELASLLSMGVLTMEEFAEAKKLIFKTASRQNATPRPSPAATSMLTAQRYEQQQRPPRPTSSVLNGGSQYDRPPSRDPNAIQMRGEQSQLDQFYASIDSATSTDMQDEAMEWNNTFTSINGNSEIISEPPETEAEGKGETEGVREMGDDTNFPNSRMMRTETTRIEQENTVEMLPLPENEARHLFIALDRRGAGVLSTIDLLQSLPMVVSSPLFKRIALKNQKVFRLSRPSTYKNEIDQLQSNVEDGIDLLSFQTWMNEDASSTSTNSKDESKTLDLRRPATKKKTKTLMLQGLDLRRPATKKKDHDQKRMQQQDCLAPAGGGASTHTTISTNTTTPASSTTMAAPELIDYPASPQQNQRLQKRIKKRIQRDKVLNKLFVALDVRGDGKLDRTEVLRALGRGTNEHVNALLSYHEDMLIKLTYPSRWKSAFHDEKFSLNGFRAFATAVLSARENEERGDNDTARIRLDDRYTLEQKQWHVIAKIFNVLIGNDTTEQIINQTTFLDAVRQNESGVKDLIESPEGECVRILKYVKRYGRAFQQYKTSAKDRMTLMEFSAFVAALTQETRDEEGVLFGEKSFMDDDEGDY